MIHMSGSWSLIGCHGDSAVSHARGPLDNQPKDPSLTSHLLSAPPAAASSATERAHGRRRAGFQGDEAGTVMETEGEEHTLPSVALGTVYCHGSLTRQQHQHRRETVQ
ncbi:hypothetical protein SKAU_G00109530 [Synaphobranchus kaupii]|uniref:Uncharacterized protein n=1 Tax=Synaphobranchus kaupii TaxID=118154 RepID=A0A9Q1G046_SYNKA|nr:hypothetical protein SKAU_G00109530 [Synaphobranchus kaupii]